MICELTKLKNRRDLVKTVTNRDDLLIAVLNINNFREVNLRYSDTAGDELLIYVAKRMKEYFNKEEYQLYRIHGASFAIVSLSVNFQKKIEQMKKFIKSVELQKHDLKESKHTIQFTAGISVGRNAFNFAEDALKEAKEDEQHITVNLKNTISEERFFNMYEEVERVKKAINTDNIVPYFQAIQDVSTGKINKYETLARLIDNEQVISPFFFIKAAKKSRLYSKITRIIIKKSFSVMSKIGAEFSINLDVTDFKNEETMNYLFIMIDKYNIAEQLIVEFLEDYEFDNNSKIVEVLNKLKNKGVRLAIDDFGTGYSNFTLLHTLKPDFLKIDGSLVKNIKDQEHFKTLKTITELATNLNIKVIAEFVENEEIYNLLECAGVDYAQGYFISKPCPYGVLER